MFLVQCQCLPGSILNPSSHCPGSGPGISRWILASIQGCSAMIWDNCDPKKLHSHTTVAVLESARFRSWMLLFDPQVWHGGFTMSLLWVSRSTRPPGVIPVVPRYQPVTPWLVPALHQLYRTPVVCRWKQGVIRCPAVVYINQDKHKLANLSIRLVCSLLCLSD